MLINFAVPNAPVVESQPVYLQERPEILAELCTSFNLTVSYNIDTYGLMLILYTH